MMSEDSQNQFDTPVLCHIAFTLLRLDHNQQKLITFSILITATVGYKYVNFSMIDVLKLLHMIAFIFMFSYSALQCVNGKK